MSDAVIGDHRKDGPFVMNGAIADAHALFWCDCGKNLSVLGLYLTEGASPEDNCVECHMCETKYRLVIKIEVIE